MRELTILQKRVLEELAWDARLPLEELARRLRIKSHSVRSALRSLEVYLDLKPVCWTNPFLQGQMSCVVLFAINCPSQPRLKRFTQYLIGLSEVHFLASLIGSYQFVVTIFASGLDSLLEMLEKLDELFGDIIVDKEISMMTHMIFFTPCLAQPVGDKRRQMGFKPTTYRANLDDLDRTIIELVRRQPVLPIGKLAQSCGIPTSTLTYRFEQLIKTGTIIGFGYAYDDHKAGYHPSILAVSTRGLSSNLFDTFAEFGRTHPDCSWVARSLGHWDLFIGVAVPELKSLEVLIQRIYEIGGASVREVVVHGVHEWFKG